MIEGKTCKKKSGYKLIFMIVCLTTVLFSCYPNSDRDAADFDVAVTFYDPDVNFSNFQTYAMPDSIVHLTDPQQGDHLTRQQDNRILLTIATNMEDLGYTREMNPETNGADVIILVSAMSDENWETYSSYAPYDSWSWYGGWGYWGWWGPSYNTYYPWGATVAYSYTTGTLILEMIDMQDVNEESELINTLWVGAINGLLEGSDSGLEFRIVSNINQCFDQSPYLDVN